MNDIRGLNIRAMITLMAMEGNDFKPSNAALDLDVQPNEVSYQIIKLESYFNYPIFYREKRKSCHKISFITGFTPKGIELYQSIKLFLNSLDCMGIFEEAA